MKMYRIVCEWDIGQENVVFTSEEKARAWCEKNEYLTEDECGYDAESAEDAGLLDFEELDVDPA